MTRRTVVGLLICAFAVCVVPGLPEGRPAHALRAAERVWQTGTWREVTVERPKVSFGVQTRDPSSQLPRVAPAREVRTYVIETETLRLELRQDVTVDTPRVDAAVGHPATFALDKKAVYVKDDRGKEHKLELRKRTAR